MIRLTWLVREKPVVPSTLGFMNSQLKLTKHRFFPFDSESSLVCFSSRVQRTHLLMYSAHILKQNEIARRREKGVGRYSGKNKNEWEREFEITGTMKNNEWINIDTNTFIGFENKILFFFFKNCSLLYIYSRKVI